MITADTYKARLAVVGADALLDTPDGRPWYRARDVCRALGLDERSTLRKVRAEYKYRRYVFARGFRSAGLWYLSRAGVETLILLKGGLPRAELLRALDEATARPHRAL